MGLVIISRGGSLTGADQFADRASFPGELVLKGVAMNANGEIVDRAGEELIEDVGRRTHR